MNMTPTVMVVEDEPAILRMVARVLESMGCDVVPADDAEAAIHQLEESHPDIVITDVRLPGMSGLELAERIEADAPDTTVVLMSAYGEPREHHADAFIAKPFDPDELVELLDPLLGSPDE
ncbi:MAG TPA: response regulator [Dehalococcoidia bacterium]|nr:response regulator [Dehalococcoidia bacterium]